MNAVRESVPLRRDLAKFAQRLRTVARRFPGTSHDDNKKYRSVERARHAKALVYLFPRLHDGSHIGVSLPLVVAVLKNFFHDDSRAHLRGSNRLESTISHHVAPLGPDCTTHAANRDRHGRDTISILYITAVKSQGARNVTSKYPSTRRGERHQKERYGPHVSAYCEKQKG